MKTNLIENRQIRVFISSTFQDMQDEREYLMRHTFPVLKLLAAKRDVTLTELDLRWGITPEEAETGKVVEICLREIENSIPFFIGIIGNRYGWVPEREDIGLNVTERFPDVKGYLERHLSVTDMEIQFGVLDREEDIHAYFFIKEKEEKQDNPEMLNSLKESVRASRYPDSTYASPEDLGLQVKEAFVRLLDELFPEQELSEAEMEAGVQRAFRNGLCHNYIRDEHYFQLIDKWLEKDESPQLVLTGASGMGKSALIANWIKEKEQTEGFTYRIAYHFVGNGGNEGHHDRVAHALAQAIQLAYGFETERNDKDTDELEYMFQKVAFEGDQPLLVVLDAVNQIEDVDNAKLLNWLPIPPKNVRILFSTVDEDKTMEVFRNRNYPTFILQPLNQDRRRQLVETYLGSFGKKLNDNQVTRIITDRQCDNTLVLKTLLDELVNFGIFERLDERINYFLCHDSVEDFYKSLLESYELEFPFTEHILSLIALSRSGLSEDELLQITDLSPLHWSQFYCSFNSHLVVKAGLITFGHNYIRKAVETRYILGNESENTTALRKEIISFFSGQTTHRALHELPYQYYVLRDDARLHDVLMDMDVFLHLENKDNNALIRYWTRLQCAYSLEEYMPLAEVSKEKVLSLYTLSVFCRLAVVVPELSLKFAKRSLDYTEVQENRIDIISSIGLSEGLLGNYEKALECQLKALELQQEVFGKDDPDTAVFLNNVSTAYAALGDYENALKYMHKALKKCEENFGYSHPATANFFDNMGTIYGKTGDYEKALKYHLKVLGIRQEIFGGKDSDTATSFHNVGIAFGELGDYEKALEYQQKALEIQQEIFGDRHPDTAMSYCNVGGTYGYLGDYQMELECQLKALDILRDIFGDIHQNTASSYNCVGIVYGELGDYEKALEYQQKALGIRREVFGVRHPDTASSFNNVGLVYKELGDYENALEYQQKALEIQQEIFGDRHPDTAVSFLNLGCVYSNLGNPQKALMLCMNALTILQEIFGDKHPDTATSFDIVGSVFKELSDYEKALEYQQKALLIRQEHFGDRHPNTVGSFNNIATTYADLGDYEKALEYNMKALEMQQEIFGDRHPDTATSFNNVGAIYAELGDYENALEYQQKALKIQQEIFGDRHPDTATSFNNVGAYYRKLGDYETALQFLSKARDLSEEMDISDDVAFYTNRLAFTYKVAGDIANAITHYRQAAELYAQLGDDEEAEKNTQAAEELETVRHIPRVPRFLKYIKDIFRTKK